MLLRTLIIGGRQPDLLEIVDTLHAPGSLASRLHGRQQECDQDGDDRDHHQKLDQRNPGRRTATVGVESCLIPSMLREELMKTISRELFPNVRREEDESSRRGKRRSGLLGACDCLSTLPLSWRPAANALWAIRWFRPEPGCLRRRIPQVRAIARANNVDSTA